MKFTSTLIFAATLSVAALQAFGQNAVKPQPVVPPVEPIVPIDPLPKPSRITAALSLAGYEFNVLYLSGKAASVFIDPQFPIAVPLVAQKAAAVTTAPAFVPGFSATLVIANNSNIPRSFTFASQYLADHKVTFTVLDPDGNTVWVSPPPLPLAFLPKSTPVTLTLKASAAWRNPVFVPLTGLAGDYTLVATFEGSPAYSATGAFTVRNLEGGPIIVGPIIPVATP